MKLYGRSHSDPKTLRRWSTLRVMDPVGVKGGRGSKVPRKVHGSKAFKMSKLSKSFKGFRTSRFQGSRVHAPQGTYGFKGTKNLRASGSRGIEGPPG